MRATDKESKRERDREREIERERERERERREEEEECALPDKWALKCRRGNDLRDGGRPIRGKERRARERDAGWRNPRVL